MKLSVCHLLGGNAIESHYPEWPRTLGVLFGLDSAWLLLKFLNLAFMKFKWRCSGMVKATRWASDSVLTAITVASWEDSLTFWRIHVESSPFVVGDIGKVDGEVGYILLKRLVDAVLRIFAFLSWNQDDIIASAATIVLLAGRFILEGLLIDHVLKEAIRGHAHDDFLLVSSISAL